MDFHRLYNQHSNSSLFSFKVVAGSLTINLVFRQLCIWLNLPFFFDSIGTAIAASLGGLLPGILTGILTNGIQELFYGFTWEYYPWALCSVSTAVVVWWFVKLRKFSKHRHAVYASIIVTLSNSIIGAIIAAYMYEGITGVPIDYIVSGLMLSGRSAFYSALAARIPSNLIDKSITVFIAFFLYNYMRGTIVNEDELLIESEDL